MKLAIVGSRTFDNYWKLFYTIKIFLAYTEIESIISEGGV